MVKFVFSKMTTKIDKIFTVKLTLTTQCQIDGEEFVNIYLKSNCFSSFFGRIEDSKKTFRN